MLINNYKLKYKNKNKTKQNEIKQTNKQNKKKCYFY